MPQQNNSQAALPMTHIKAIRTALKLDAEDRVFFETRDPDGTLSIAYLYCINPDCPCREITVELQRVVKTFTIGDKTGAELTPVVQFYFHLDTGHWRNVRLLKKNLDGYALTQEDAEQLAKLVVTDIIKDHRQMLRDNLSHAKAYGRMTIEQRLRGPETVQAGRNDPCPCGSGKKYKHCCGR